LLGVPTSQPPLAEADRRVTILRWRTRFARRVSSCASLCPFFPFQFTDSDAPERAGRRMRAASLPRSDQRANLSNCQRTTNLFLPATVILAGRRPLANNSAKIVQKVNVNIRIVCTKADQFVQNINLLPLPRRTGSGCPSGRPPPTGRTPEGAPVNGLVLKRMVSSATSGPCARRAVIDWLKAATSTLTPRSSLPRSRACLGRGLASVEGVTRSRA
jgi:hypothetical protein